MVNWCYKLSTKDTRSTKKHHNTILPSDTFGKQPKLADEPGI